MPSELAGMFAEVMEIAAFVIGAAFCLLAGVGILRMPDIYTRMQASTKAGTLGIACLIIGVGIHFSDTLTGLEAALVVAFLFLTAPIASHLIARASYIMNVAPWEKNVIDDMASCYDQSSQELLSPDEAGCPVPVAEPDAASASAPQRSDASGV